MQTKPHQIADFLYDWFTRISVLLLVTILIIAPTLHVCSMGAEGPAPQQSIKSSHNPELAQLHQAAVPIKFCLAMILRNMMGNHHFALKPIFVFRSVAVFQPELHLTAAKIVSLQSAARSPPLSLL